MRGKLQDAGCKWGIPLVMMWCYAMIVRRWFPLVPAYEIRLVDLRDFRPEFEHGLAYAGVLLLLFALNWTAAHLPRSRIAAFLWPVFFSLPLLFTYPINANDVFRYFLRGRITALFGESPYVTSPSALPDGAYTYLAGEWANAVSPYGPIWEGVNALVVLLANDDLLSALIVFKIIGLLSVLGVGWVILQLTDLRRAMLWLWNPAVLYMLVMDAHNDGVVLFWIVLGIWVWKEKESPVLATLIMLLAPLTKLSGIVPIPFFGLVILRDLPSWDRRVRYVVSSAVGAVALVFVSFLPFGSPMDLLTRLLSEAQDSGGFSPLAYVYFVGQEADWFTVDIFRWVEYGTPTFVILSGVLLIFVLLGRDAEMSSAESYYIYLATAFKFRIWYTLWLFPFALLSTSRYQIRAAYLLLVTSQLSVIIYGHMREALFDGESAMAHLIGVPFVFILPLILPLFAQNRVRNASKPM